MLENHQTRFSLVHGEPLHELNKSGDLQVLSFDFDQVLTTLSVQRQLARLNKKWDEYHSEELIKQDQDTEVLKQLKLIFGFNKNPDIHLAIVTSREYADYKLENMLERLGPIADRVSIYMRDAGWPTGEYGIEVPNHKAATVLQLKPLFHVDDDSAVISNTFFNGEVIRIPLDMSRFPRCVATQRKFKSLVSLLRNLS